MMQEKSLKFNKKPIVPLVLLVWLLASLSFTVLIPRADATHSGTEACPHNEAEAMTSVYSPERFRILNLCQKASGTITHYEIWGDGDWNVYVKLDDQYTNLVDGSGISKLQTWAQARRNDGADMIWEAIPRDVGESGKKGTTTGPLSPCEPLKPDGLADGGSKLERATVSGVHVADKWHGWKEIHPITSITKDGGTTCSRSEPSSTGSSGGSGQCKETWGWGGRNRC